MLAAKMEFESSTVQLFVDTLREVVRSELARSMKPPKDDTILTVKELADYLKVTPKWVHNRTHLKELPFYKLSNKQLRFRKRDIDKWLDSIKTPALSPLSPKVKLIE